MPVLFKNISANIIETFTSDINLFKNIGGQIGYGVYINVYGFEAFLQDYSKVSSIFDLIKPNSFGLVNNSEQITLAISGTLTTYQERTIRLSNIRNSIIRSFNTSSGICTFTEPQFGITGATKIFSAITSGSSGVYIIDTATTITLGVVFTANTEAFTANSAAFKYEIYKFDHDFSGFNRNRVYHLDAISYSSFTITSIVISGAPTTYSAITNNILISDLNIDGDYLIKGYYEYKSCTDYLNRLGIIYDTSLFKTGTTYNYYNPSTDYYFIAITAADEPIFRGINQTTLATPTLHQQVILPTDGQTVFAISNNIIGSFLVTLNGLVLANDYDYTVSGYNITLTGETISEDIITIIYTTSGTNGVVTDILDITSITSGTTDNQGNNNIYYNTTTGKYEIFTSLNPIVGNDIIVMINGVTLANNIDYYQSTSNLKRIILEGSVLVGDIITIAYFAYPDVVNGISINTPSIAWSIETAPQLNNGLFILQIADSVTFSNVIFTATTPYVSGQTLYNTTVTITGSVGTEYWYRVKNDKIYVSANGNIIESIAFSEIVPIIIETNSINSY